MFNVKASLVQVNAFYYPVLMVSCGNAPNSYYREQPSLIIEVLSTCAAKFDRGDKRRAYQSLPSLQEYAFVSQESMDMRDWRRRVKSGWLDSDDLL